MLLNSKFLTVIKANMNISGSERINLYVLYFSLSILLTLTAISCNRASTFKKEDLNNNRQYTNNETTTILGVSLGKDSFKEIRGLFGEVEAFQPKNADRHVKKICYVSSNISDKTKLLFVTGPMGGWKTAVGFVVMSGDVVFEDEDNCMMSNEISKNIETSNGIRLGFDKKSVKLVFGSPIKESQNNLRYEMLVNVRLTEKEIANLRKLNAPGMSSIEKHPFYTRSFYISFDFKNDRLQSFDVFKSESF